MSVGKNYLFLNIFQFTTYIIKKPFFYVNDMKFIELMANNKSISFSLIRLNNLIMLYEATI